MEANLSSASTMQGNNSPYGGFDLQAPMRNHHHHHHHQQQQQHSLALHHQHNSHPTNFPLTIGNAQDCDQWDRGKSGSDEDELSLTEDPSKGKKASPWQRVKWTNMMVRLLITAVSYISEETAAEYANGPRRKISNLQKKGKWKSVSKVMAERGHFVSPQQCEDKFNDLNKRYKRLNEILGRGTSCEVVENPTLLDGMDHISEKAKEEVRKILSSKHLHYEEMCSFHNGNRLHLPPDPDLQRSLRLALTLRDDHDDNDGGVDQNGDQFDGHDESEDNGDHHRGYGLLAKRVKQCQSNEDFSFTDSLDCNKSFSFLTELVGGDVNQVPNEGEKVNVLQKQWMNHRNLQLEEQRLHIQAQMLELEKEHFKWQRFCKKKDRELELMKMEIERMKLENERMALELRQKEIGIDNN